MINIIVELTDQRKFGTMRQPFYLKSRKAWFLKISRSDGSISQIPLGKTKKAAFEKWRILNNADGTSSALTAMKVIGLFIEAMNDRVELGQLEEKTVARRILRIVPFCKWMEKKHPGLTVDQLKPFHVSTWLRTKDSWNATTRYDAASNLKQAFNWATKEGRIDRNPITHLEVEKGESRDCLIERTEYEKILQNAGGSKFNGKNVRAFRPVLIALWLSGCRPSEIRRVRIEDFDGKRWTIKKHKTRKKKKKPRQIFVSPCLGTLSKIVAHGRSSGPLFQPKSGEKWEYSEMRRRFERLRKRIDANPKLVMYSFRHTWITNAMLSGEDVATIASLAGTSIRMIDEHYGHLSQHESHLEIAALRIAARENKEKSA